MVILAAVTPSESVKLRQQVCHQQHWQLPNLAIFQFILHFSLSCFISKPSDATQRWLDNRDQIFGLFSHCKN